MAGGEVAAADVSFGPMWTLITIWLVCGTLIMIWLVCVLTLLVIDEMFFQ